MDEGRWLFGLGRDRGGGAVDIFGEAENRRKKRVAQALLTFRVSITRPSVICIMTRANIMHPAYILNYLHYTTT